MKYCPSGLRQHLFFAIIAPLLLVFAVSVALGYRLARETADAAFDHSLADAVLDIASHVRTGNASLEIELSGEAEAMLRSDASDTIYFAVRDSGGHLLAGDPDLPVENILALAAPAGIFPFGLGR